MKKMGINRKYFKKIYQNNFLKSDMSKAVAYKKILKKEKVKPTQIVVIGDNYHNDILPALDLGMQGACVGGLEDVRTVLGNLI